MRRKRNGSLPIVSLMSPFAAHTAPIAARNTRISRSRILTLMRLSASSWVNTAATPVHGEPSRGMANLFEIAGVDVLETRNPMGEAQELAARSGDGPRDLRPDIAHGIDPELARRHRLDIRDPGNGCENRR